MATATFTKMASFPQHPNHAGLGLRPRFSWRLPTWNSQRVDGFLGTEKYLLKIGHGTGTLCIDDVPIEHVVSQPAGVDPEGTLFSS